MPSTERSFYLLKTRTICVIFLYNCMQCIDGSSILLQRYVTKGNDAKNPGGVGHGSRDSIRPTNVVSAGAMVDTFFVAS